MYIYKRDLYLYKNVYRSISQSTMYFKAEIKVIIKSNGEMEVFFPRHSTQTQHQYVISLSSSGYSESSSLLYVDINVELSRQNNVCLSVLLPEESTGCDSDTCGDSQIGV